MSTNSKQSTKEIFLLSLGTVIGTVIICSSTVFGFAFLWKECSQLIANPIIYPSSWW